MVSRSSGKSSHANLDKDKALRYRTRDFAAECLSLLPEAVGTDAAHFDLSLARKLASVTQSSGDWLVLQLQELISLAYQISTIQFENMRPIGVGLLSTILEKFKLVADPELPGHLLLEQYQAQLVSAVRTALDANSGPVLLEAGLQLATKIMTSGIISSDQVAVKRIFSLLSRPLNDFNELYYPSFAEWVTSKIKIRLLTAHASLKCYIFTFLRKHHGEVPVEFEALLPLFSKSSDLLGRYWIQVLRGYSYVCLFQNPKRSQFSILDEIPPHTVSRRLQPCLDEAWPVILQALVLDAIPVNHSVEEFSDRSLISRHRMVTLEVEDYQFLWGFAVLVLFQGMHPGSNTQAIPFGSTKIKNSGDSSIKESSFQGLKLHEIALPVFLSLSAERFFSSGFLSIDLCQELLQVFSYSFYMDSSWDILAVSVVQQISQTCPKDFLECEQFAYSTIELCLGHLFKILHRHNKISPNDDDDIWDNLLSTVFISIKTLVTRFELKNRLMSAPLALLLSGYKCIRQVPTDAYLPKALEIVKSTNDLLLKLTRTSSQKPYTDAVDADSSVHLGAMFGACVHVVGDLTKDCIDACILSGTNFSLAKFANELHCLGDETETDSICIAVLKSCLISIAAVVKDSSMQVQATALQVLKGLVQRYNNIEEKSFVIFFVGELIGDIVSLMQRAILKPMNKESVVIAGECLRFIMLLQMNSNVDEHQKGFMSIFLESVLVVFSKTSDDISQEVLELRNVAVRLVSHLAQLPSSAVHFKDVLLSLPTTHRQQLQIAPSEAKIFGSTNGYQITSSCASGSKTESVTEEETGFPESSSIQDDESNKSPLAEEANDQHLASDRASDTKEDSVDDSEGVEEETVESSLNEEALLTSQNDKISSDDHLVELKEESVESRKSSEPEIIGVDTKLPLTEADSPTLDDTPDDLDPQQFSKSVQDDQVGCSNEHVVSEKTVAEKKSEED
ncbi:hypothetical protein Bca52824_015907 [Brassica carinata]|uniref:HEAT repeat-containing protein n=1 Tax=Brassica carinata TaxID=52824 RepID=A0A8X7W2U9_BRACI|nr:hypothetical protein Bca52824_015907 [Brassica carinata]